MPAKRSPVPLSRDRITDAALDLVDSYGVPALTMRGLAQVLAVDPMAMYHHVPNKAALVSLVQERVLDGLVLGGESHLPWQIRLTALLRRFRQLSTEHPHVFPGIIASSYTSAGINRAVNEVLAILLDAGFGPVRAVHMGDSVFSTVTGFVLLEINTAARADTPPPVLDEELTTLARLAPELASNSFPDSFEACVDMLIAGLEAELRRSPDQSPDRVDSQV